MAPRSWFTLPLLLLFSGALYAAGFTLRVVDGLGRPVPDVLVRVYCYVRHPGQARPTEVILLEAQSDSRGIVRGNDGQAAAGREYQVRLDKPGYSDDNYISIKDALRGVRGTPTLHA
jgi:hypothetical protein